MPLYTKKERSTPNPCPCGGKVIVADDLSWTEGRNRGITWKYIYCQGCGRTSNRYFWDDREDLIAEWNEMVKQ